MARLESRYRACESIFYFFLNDQDLVFQSGWYFLLHLNLFLQPSVIKSIGGGEARDGAVTLPDADRWVNDRRSTAPTTSKMLRLRLTFCDHTIEIGRDIIFLETGQLPTCPKALL